ncbi:MAG TPA: hypothetical protein VFU38_08335 [Candidatus Krumholzibacteria bacterium]|nr:hypothetical protein [Candidatus Krumholzibacteria bacterium]
MKSMMRVAMYAALAAALGACGNTQVLDSWQDPDLKPSPVKRIVVVGLSGDEITRRLFEDTFTKELKERGNDAVAGHTFMPKDAEANPDSALAALRKAGFDAVLTARSLGVHTEETVTEGTPYYIPDSGYYGWNGYYGAVYQDITATTYTTRTEKARVETHLYDTAKAKLLWAARSETTSTGKLTEGMRDYARTVVGALAKTGLID